MKNIFNFLALVTPRISIVSFKKISQFGLAVRAAIANINIYTYIQIYIYIYERRALLYRFIDCTHLYSLYFTGDWSTVLEILTDFPSLVNCTQVYSREEKTNGKICELNTPLHYAVLLGMYFTHFKLYSPLF